MRNQPKEKVQFKVYQKKLRNNSQKNNNSQLNKINKVNLKSLYKDFHLMPLMVILEICLMIVEIS